MPEGRESVDSFDDFFGVSKDEGTRKKSSIKPKETDSTIGVLVKTQPVIKRPQTPSTPEEQIPLTPKTKPKINTNTHIQNASPIVSERVESVQSKNYESDFDEEENDFEKDESIPETPIERSKPTSLPPPKQRSSDQIRRGSDSELRKSYTVAQRSKPKNENPPVPAPVRRKENHLPNVKPKPVRQLNPPNRRRNEMISNSAKSELEQRALSAKHDKLKSLEARIAELRRELETQRIENSTLRTIQRREEKAIKKYEEKEYDIHRIIRDYSNQIEHIRSVLLNERDVKQRLEKQIEVREEKLRDQTEKLKKYEKIVQEKHLDERYELKEKLTEADKKLQTYQEKLTHHEKFIETLEKNHQYEIKQELVKQRDLKRQLEARAQKYNELVVKFEDKTRQIDTMHIYAQRTIKYSDSPSNLSKARSLQSLNDNSPRSKEKTTTEQERKSRSKQQQPSLTKKPPPKKENENKSSSTSTTENGHLPPKGKPPARRLSTPRSIDEIEEDETIFGKTSKKLPPPPSSTTQKSEPPAPQAQIHKRSVAPSSSTTAAGGGNSTVPSSIFKLTEPTAAAAAKPRQRQDLDEKWSNMFGDNKQEDSAKEDLLAKLVADEQQERRQAAAAQRSSMNMFESSTPSTTTKPTTTVKPSADPFDTLFSNNSSKPTGASRTNDLDDFFSSKPSTQQPTTTVKPSADPFESLFGPARTTEDSRQNASQNDKLQRPKVVQNPTRTIPNRTTFDEVEDFVL